MAPLTESATGSFWNGLLELSISFVQVPDGRWQRGGSTLRAGCHLPSMTAPLPGNIPQLQRVGGSAIYTVALTVPPQFSLRMGSEAKLETNKPLLGDQGVPGAG